MVRAVEGSALETPQRWQSGKPLKSQELWYLGDMEETVPLKPVKQEQSRKLQRILELREVSRRSQFQLFGLRFK